MVKGCYLILVKCTAHHTWFGVAFLCGPKLPVTFKVCFAGSTFLYSTHAFTLLSAVVERAAGQGFLDHMKKLFNELGMAHTVPEENEPIIYHRSR